MLQTKVFPLLFYNFNIKSLMFFKNVCYNRFMVKHVSKVIIESVCVLAVASSLATMPTRAVEQNTNFQVNVRDSLSVSITTPSEWTSGNVNTFLCNQVTVQATSNAPGITMSMHSKTTDTSLTNTFKNTETLPTLASNATRSSFPANYWGFSTNDTNCETSSSTYQQIKASNETPSTLYANNASTTHTQNVYFGAKADMSQASGTYAGIVVIDVVTGVVDSSTNPITPTNPAQPNNAYEVATYRPSPTGNSSRGVTTYTYRRHAGSGSSATTTTTTEVSEDNNVSAYAGYTPPQGVVNSTTSSISDGSPLAAGLAATAGVAAASGILFFILAKRRDDDDEDENQSQ